MYTTESIMPSGKYKGEKLGSLPSTYLLWLTSEMRKKAPNKRSLHEKQLIQYVEGATK